MKALIVNLKYPSRHTRFESSLNANPLHEFVRALAILYSNALVWEGFGSRTDAGRGGLVSFVWHIKRLHLYAKLFGGDM